MTAKVVTVEPDDKLSLVKEIFDNVRFHHLMVMEGGRLVGVISDRDLLKSLSPFIHTQSARERDERTLDKRVHQIMSRKPVTAAPDVPVAVAARMMVDHNISCLPILENGKLEGIVTWKDLLRHVVIGEE